uniref:Uncharacterized protein n=1 Tax=viral metagenome TaxID=1070528 RepID=A0A6C0JVT3_9ZZZZ
MSVNINLTISDTTGNVILATLIAYMTVYLHISIYNNVLVLSVPLTIVLVALSVCFGAFNVAINRPCNCPPVTYYEDEKLYPDTDEPVTADEIVEEDVEDEAEEAAEEAADEAAEEAADEADDEADGEVDDEDEVVKKRLDVLLGRTPVKTEEQIEADKVAQRNLVIEQLTKWSNKIKEGHTPN